jgi:hypothetical protein
MITNLNAKIIAEAKATGEHIYYCFAQGNTEVWVGRQKFNRVRALRFHDDMAEAGFERDKGHFYKNPSYNKQEAS